MITKIKNIITIVFFTIILTACDGPQIYYNGNLTKDIFRSSDSKLADFASSLDIYIIDKRSGWESESWLRKNNKGHKIIIDKVKMKQIISGLMHSKPPPSDALLPRLVGEELHIILTTSFGRKAYIKIYGFKNKSNKAWIVATYNFSAYGIFPSKSLQEVLGLRNNESNGSDRKKVPTKLDRNQLH
jgi:hypothetical protein